jgi:hypothetical protein
MSHLAGVLRCSGMRPRYRRSATSSQRRSSRSESVRPTVATNARPGVGCDADESHQLTASGRRAVAILKGLGPAS